MSLILFIFISFRESTRREWGGEAFRWSWSSIADRTSFHFSVFFSFVQVSWYERRHGMLACILPSPCLVWDNFRLVYPPSDSECDSSGDLTQFHLSIISVRFVGVLFAVYIFLQQYWAVCKRWEHEEIAFEIGVKSPLQFTAGVSVRYNHHKNCRRNRIKKIYQQQVKIKVMLMSITAVAVQIEKKCGKYYLSCWMFSFLFIFFNRMLMPLALWMFNQPLLKSKLTFLTII